MMTFRGTATRLFFILSTMVLLPHVAWSEGGGGGSNSPTIGINPGIINVTEGDSGTTTVTSTISISECPDTDDIVVNWGTSDASATSTDNDYIPAGGSVTFTHGAGCTLSYDVSVQVKGDTKYEGNEYFYITTGVSTSASQSWTAGQSSTDVRILNDEPAANLMNALYAYDNSDGTPTDTFNYNDTVKIRALIRNYGPNDSEINFDLTLPGGLDYTATPAAVGTEGNSYGVTCSPAGNVIHCSNSGTGTPLPANGDVWVVLYAKVTTQMPIEMLVTSSVESSQGIFDPSTPNNSFDLPLYINVPGDLGNIASIGKTVDNTTPTIGSTITFDLTVTNHGLPKKLRMLDFFPTLSQGNYAGSTGGAFQYLSHTIDEPDVSCYYSYFYFYCGTSTAYADNQSFHVHINAKVLRRGLLTNRGHSYYTKSDDSWQHSGSDDAQVNATGNRPPSLAAIPDQNTVMGSPFSFSVAGYVSDPDLPDETFTYTATGLPPGLTMATNGQISGTSTTLGDYSVTVTVTDSYGATATATFTLHVTMPPLHAYDNNYTTPIATPVSGNFITDTSGGLRDTGTHIVHLSHTNPSEGTLTVSSDGYFTYTPLTTTLGSITFNYTITDDSNATDTATVTIHLQTTYHQGFADFELINPPHTRNIIGDFAVIGNTLECVTNYHYSYGGSCQNNRSYNDNNYMTKYIDSDSDSDTWNSSSSTLVLPSTYDRLGGNGILWAGLYWQGGINEHVTYSWPFQHKQRRAIVSGGSWVYHDVNTSAAITVSGNGGENILLDIDGGGYHAITATDFYYDTVLGDYGGYYAGYVNVTALLQAQNLADGNHTITVANLTTNEGREAFVGNYGGWSLVVIYKEDNLNGKPRNISIYKGYNVIDQDGAVQQAHIHGFKLPKTGPIRAKFAAFVGEGEYEYGRRTSEYDKMTLRRLPSGADSDMPGAIDPSNIFDAKLSNIPRDSSGDNALDNTNGIDIDLYDVSSIMESYRAVDHNISDIYIRLSSNQDYATPSMMAFSAELYKPDLCYDYTLSLGSYVIPSVNNAITTDYGALSQTMVTHVSIKSKEADFKLKDVNVTYGINDTSQVNYISGTTMTAPFDQNAYLDASAQTTDETNAGFLLYIGTGAGPGQGGSIDAFETRYFKFDDHLNSSSVNTSFDLAAHFKVNYGSGDLTLHKIFTSASLCNGTNGYYPAPGLFNVASNRADTAPGNFGKPYNLYTQVANRPFNAQIFSYQNDLSSPKPVTTHIEVELYNANYFERNTILSCNNPDSNLTPPSYVEFNNQSHIDFNNLSYPFAARNAGFRIWDLRTPDGSSLSVTCGSRSDEACFDTLYADHFTSETKCTTACSSGGSGCYQCLKDNYAVPICSRDNFAIRPEAFMTTIGDNAESNSTLSPITVISNSKQPSAYPGVDNSATLAAGYGYVYDVNATSHTDDNATPGYIQTFAPTSSNAAATMTWSPATGQDVSGCNDSNDSNISITLFNGTSFFNGNILLNRMEQVGHYAFGLEDSNWTAVDWGNPIHHAQPGFDNSQADCEPSNDIVYASTDLQNRQGCVISSNHSNVDMPATYLPTFLRFYPYNINVSGLALGGGPQNNSPVIYINDLNATPNYPSGYHDTGDKNMSYNILGDIFAQSRTGARLSNFVDRCYADPLDIELQATYRHDPTPLNGPNLGYDLNSTTDYFEHNYVQDQNQTLTIPYPAAYFKKEDNGSSRVDVGLNFARNIDTPLNPRLIEFTDLNISYHTQPVNLIINRISDNKIFGDDDALDQNISFVYGRIRPLKEFYDNIIPASVVTPVSAEFYCDLGFGECQRRVQGPAVFDLAAAHTSSNQWWRQRLHNTANGDGNIVIFERSASARMLPRNNTLTIDTNGSDEGVQVIRDSNATLPLIVPVEIQSYRTPGAYTDRWLLYNPEEDAFPAAPLYRVRFIGNSGWTGTGKTGHVVGGAINRQKHRRTEW